MKRARADEDMDEDEDEDEVAQRPRPVRPDESPEMGYAYSHFAAQGRLTAPVRRSHCFEPPPRRRDF